MSRYPVNAVHAQVERRDGFIVLSGIGTLHFEARSHATLETAEADARQTAATSPDVVVVLPAVLFKAVRDTASRPHNEPPPTLDARIAALVAGRFGGDYRAAFAHYDTDGDGVLTKGELKAVLADAGIGSGLTRWAWASGVMGELDANGDGGIDWAEFDAAARRASAE